jgi:hypothetical protein
MELQIGLSYLDKELGKILYIGRTGYEINIPILGKQKGKHVFVTMRFKHPVMVKLSKQDTKDLKIIK